MTDADQNISADAERLLGRLTLEEKVSLLSGADAWRTKAVDRIGIPSVVMTDGPHAVRADERVHNRLTGPTTVFPTGIGLASSWNPGLVERVAAALADETAAMGCHILLGPCVNILRAPLAGRNFETYGEDPFLAARIGTAWVNGVQSRGIGASLKHFACNNQEYQRRRGDSVVDERALREIYLRQFEMIVKEARPWTVMCSYNRINGVHASQHDFLLRSILKGEWDYDGAVISDWGANHSIVESINAGLDLEMPGPAMYFGRLLVQAALHWQVPQSQVDDAARRILRLVLRCGRPDKSERHGSVNTAEHQSLAREAAGESITLLKNADGLLPLDMSQIRSIAVIGPNADEARLGGGGSAYAKPPYRISPLEGLRRKFGSRTDIRYEKGCDNKVVIPFLDPEWCVPESGTGSGLTGSYYNGPDLRPEPVAEQTDAVFAGGEFSFPAGVDGKDFLVRWTGTITVPENGIYRFVLNACGTASMAIDNRLLAEIDSDPRHESIEPTGQASACRQLKAGTPYSIAIEYRRPPSAQFARLFVRARREDDADNGIVKAAELAAGCDVAIVCAGLPEFCESEGFDRDNMDLPGAQSRLIEAVAKANSRTVLVLNCGAPVSISWLDSVKSLLAAYYPGMEGGTALASILCGETNPSGRLPFSWPARYEDNPTCANYPGARQVRYEEGIFVGYRHYDHEDIAPLFPFGAGLSYSTFEYSELRVPGKFTTDEPFHVSAQVRNTGWIAGSEVAQLYVSDLESRLPRPPKELKGFAKIHLQPGQSGRVEFALDRSAFAYFDPKDPGWVVEPGEFEIMIGSSSRDIRLRAITVLQALPEGGRQT